VSHFNDWGLTSLLTLVYHKVVWQHVLKIGQYLTKLCVDYVGLLFLAHPVKAHKDNTEYTERAIYAIANPSVRPSHECASLENS